MNIRSCLRLLGKRGGLRRLLGVLLVAGLLAGLGGCTRIFFRRQADREVNDILAEKDRYPAWWKIQQFHVYPDPRARFADPSNPDHPPMPTDDEAAWQLSPHPQQPGKAGVANVGGTGWLEIMKVWDGDNRAERQAAGPAKDATPAPDKRAPGEDILAGNEGRPVQALFDMNVTQEGFLLNLAQTVELGLINAREYQSIREDLYFAALPVTLQRFSFAWQWTAIENAVRQWAGAQSSAGHQNRWALGSTSGTSKLFSTGALLTTAFANNTVFSFLHNGTPSLSSASTFNLDLVQPLLRGGGKAVTLEPLTQVERNLLYQIRAYARWREQFFLSVALGTAPPGDLPTASGTTNGGVGPISLLASLGIASTDVSGQFRGYFPTLFRQLDMAVDQKYVHDLERALQLFQGFEEGGQVSPLQVSQVRVALLNSRNAVLKDYQDKTNALDQFKLQLGIPINLPLVLDDTPGRPITRQYDRYYEVLAEANAAYKLVEAQQDLPTGQLRGFLRRLFTAGPLVQGTEFQRKVPAAWDALNGVGDAGLKNRLEQLTTEHRKLLDLKTDLEVKGQALPAEAAFRLREGDFESELVKLEQLLRRYEARPWAKLPKEAAERDRTKQFRLIAYATGIVLVYARNERFERVGTLWPELPAVCLEGFDFLNEGVDKAQQAAVQLALTNRVDLMNARAQVVDAWRKLRVTANALLGIFNVAYHLDSATPAGQARPFAFAPSRTNQELILNAQLPLVRVSERNTYRTALIDYQRARRALMNLEDNIAAQVRFDVRQLHLFAANYKIQQKVVELYYTQVENALEVIAAPVDPDALKQTGTAGQAAAAALTNQYLGALGSLNGAQTNMYRLWLSFLATRMELYLDLERLSLNNRGVWTDESGLSADLDQSGVGGAHLGQPVAGLEREPAAGEPVARPRLLPPAAGPPLE